MRTQTLPAPQRLTNGARTVRGRAVAILVSKFHPALSRGLVAAATHELRASGVAAKSIRQITVPGAFELPVVAAKLAKSRRAPDAIIALGILIRGETAQYEVIAHAVADGLAKVSVETGVPVAFGVIVAETLAQAEARAVWPARRAKTGPVVENRGAEAARAAIAVMRLFETLGRS